MQKKIFLLPLIVLISIYYLSSTTYHLVHAASPSPSSTPPLSEVTENLKKRLQESLDIKEVSPLSAARAYVGVVKDMIKDTIIIEDKDGKKDIKLQDDTSIFRSPGNAAIKPENIRIDDYIIAIGFPEGNDTLNGRRLVVSTDPIKSPAKSSGLGIIEKLGKTTLTMLVDGQEQILSLTGKTIYKSAAGSIEPTDLAVGDTFIYTATINVNDELTATVIMRILSASISQ